MALTTDEFAFSATDTIGDTADPCFSHRCTYHLEVVDTFDNTLQDVSVNQQMQLRTDLANGQNHEQSFVYFLQVKNSIGTVMHLKLVSGSLSQGQSFSSSLPWTPVEAGIFTATAFVWGSVENAITLEAPCQHDNSCHSGGPMRLFW